jgi:hypothetical protein
MYYELVSLNMKSRFLVSSSTYNILPSSPNVYVFDFYINFDHFSYLKKIKVIKKSNIILIKVMKKSNIIVLYLIFS